MWIQPPSQRLDACSISGGEAEGGDNALQGVVSTLLAEILSLYPAEQIFTPADLLGRGGVWPSMDELVAAGKRVSFTSGTDYGTGMAPLIFDRSAPSLHARHCLPTLHAARPNASCMILLLQSDGAHASVFHVWSVLAAVLEQMIKTRGL